MPAIMCQRTVDQPAALFAERSASTIAQGLGGRLNGSVRPPPSTLLNERQNQLTHF